MLLVFEAAGKNEAAEGIPLVGRAGFTFGDMLQRGGMKRADFRIANVLSCRPPKNKLSGEPYEQAAVNHCAPLLDAEIANYHPRCVIAGGAVALRRLLPEVYEEVGRAKRRKKGGILSEVRGYTFWSQKYQTWAIPTFHPSHIMRGRTGLSATFIHDIQRATEVAASGYEEVDTSFYLIDPDVQAAQEWYRKFNIAYLSGKVRYLSDDIETPDKDSDEGELDPEADKSFIITRCGYAYHDGQQYHVMSLPWAAEFMATHRALQGSKCGKLFWNKGYDDPRIRAQMTLGGAIHDGMEAWHILNSDLPKGLGSVTTYFPDNGRFFPLWKHLAQDKPGYYNGMDVHSALNNMFGIEQQMRKHGLWDLYEEHYLRFAPVTSAMSAAGMPIDHERRLKFARRLGRAHKAVRQRMQPLVPEDVKRKQPKHGYKKEPADKTGLNEVLFNKQVVVRCKQCGAADPKRPHFTQKKSPCFITKAVIEQWKQESIDAVGDTPGIVDEKHAKSTARKYLATKYSTLVHEVAEGQKRWARVLPFTPSRVQIIDYGLYQRHKQVMVGRGEDRKPSTDKKAIAKLMGWYPNDQLYPLTLKDREVGKLRGTYIGEHALGMDGLPCVIKGFPVGKDGRIHPTFTNTPSTYRMSMVAPNLQNLPRIAGSSLWQQMVRKVFVAPEGSQFWGVDFTGIEAVLVGYFAQSQRYVRLAKLGVHDFFNAHVLAQQGRITAADLPDLKWSDADLSSYFKALKKRFKAEREVAKRCVHGGNYIMTAVRMFEEYPETFKTIANAARIRSQYYELFDEIPRWHRETCLKIDQTCYVKNPFGFPHRFYRVLEWQKVDGKWEWEYGDDAKRLIAFLPQSTAAFIIRAAGMRIYYNYPDVARSLRLFIHDEIFGEAANKDVERDLHVAVTEMSKAIPQLPLDPAWGMGSHLTIGTEAKIGQVWALMQEPQLAVAA